METSGKNSEVDAVLIEMIRKITRDELSHHLDLRGIDFDPSPLSDGFKPEVISWDSSAPTCVKNSICLVRAAILAYENQDLIEREIARCQDVEQLSFFDHSGTHTQAFVLQLKSATIVAFRGTEYRDISAQLYDVYRDALIRKIRLSESAEAGMVHSGFLAGLDSVWPEMWKAICQTPAENTLWFTGHSLGGALATLAAAKTASQSTYTIGGLVTIGQPRVGDEKFRKWLRSIGLRGARDGGNVVRIAKARDPITMVPPELMGYKHNDGFVFVSPDGRISPEDEDKRPFLVGLLVVANAIKALIHISTGIQFSYGALIGDHNSKRYLTHLRAHLRKLRHPT